MWAKIAASCLRLVDWAKAANVSMGKLRNFSDLCHFGLRTGSSSEPIEHWNK